MPIGADRQFVPSRDGFHFANSTLPGRPVRVLGMRVGAVVGGLCGGMCLAARDRWRGGRPAPPNRSCPESLLRTIQIAQLRSFRIPWAPARYLRLQQPAAGPARLAATLGDAVPAVRRSVPAGGPLLLGLVCSLGRSPGLLSRHHVVLATTVVPGGSGTAPYVDIGVYDPNHPDDDGVVLRVAEDGTVRHNRGRAVHALFGLDRPRLSGPRASRDRRG